VNRKALPLASSQTSAVYVTQIFFTIAAYNYPYSDKVHHKYFRNTFMILQRKYADKSLI